MDEDITERLRNEWPNISTCIEAARTIESLRQKLELALQREEIAYAKLAILENALVRKNHDET